MISRLVVVGAMPKRRKDSAIYSPSKYHCEMGRRRGNTLLFGLNEKTISECTFRLLRRFDIKSFIARYVAARAWILDTIYRGG